VRGLFRPVLTLGRKARGNSRDSNFTPREIRRPTLRFLAYDLGGGSKEPDKGSRDAVGKFGEIKILEP